MSMIYRVSIQNNSDEVLDFYESLSLNYDEFGVEVSNQIEAVHIYNKALKRFSNNKVNLYYETQDYDSHNPDHKQIVLY